MIEEGKHFTVEIHDTYVVKTPKIQDVRDRLEKIAGYQNELAKHFEEILPCRLEDGKLIMPRAKGVRCDQLDEDFFNNNIRPRLQELRVKAARYKIQLNDVRDVNTFYDKEEDKIYFIDLSSAHKCV